MRTIDRAKQRAIVEAVYDLTAEVGLVGISMSKVASAASVSPATIYIYYKDKTDLLSRMYEEVKDLMDRGLAEAVEAAAELEDKVRVAQWHFIRRFQAHPREARFLESVLVNSSLIDQRALDYAAEQAAPIRQIFEALLQNPAYRGLTESVATAFFSTPLRLAGTASDGELETAITMSLRALKQR
jgi:AcrR family transcriptional regulator